MTESDYTAQSKNLSEAVDIAIDSLKKFPPKGFNSTHLNHMISTYLGFKNNALNPDPKYKNSKSLSYIKDDIFTYFQEGTGEAIQYFWKEVKKRNLGYKRENKLLKILQRQKIKNKIEYDFIIDVLVPYQQDGLLTDKEVSLLNKMISEFEKK